MRIISVRQPWAQAIFELGKDVENRTWSTNYRGLLLIQTSLKEDKDFWVSKAWVTARGRRVFEGLDRPRGVIIGFVELYDVQTRARSRWAETGAYHWMLASPVLLPTPILCAGRLGLWAPDSRVIRALKKVL